MRSRATRRVLWIGFFLCVVVVLGVGKRRVKDFKFPAEFLWGAATAAHQVEGGNTNNDWYEWENAGHTADRSGAADDFYHRYTEDLELARGLGHNAFRLSIEWSRIEPEQGKFSSKELLYYKNVLQAARARGLKTFVTLHHFTNPLWASHQGGWLNEEMPRWFGEFVEYVVPNLGELVDFWITVNEPNVNVLTSYVAGVTPPGVKDISKAVIALSGFMKAHARAYHIIHDFYPDAKVGFAHHMRVFSAARWWNPGDALVAGYIDAFWNKQILQAMKTGRISFSIPFVFNYDERWPELENTLDFVGVNYYTRDLVKLDLSTKEKFAIVAPAGVPLSDLGWEIYPEGMSRSLAIAGSFGVPVYVTENGIADAKDVLRKDFLCSHLSEVAGAMQDGVDVRGYLHWALIDNFEWVSGFEPRFGLVEVDYATQARKVRGSALFYRDVILSRGLGGCSLVEN